MPFGFLKRKRGGTSPKTGTATPTRLSGRGIPFDGLTEEWRIVGNMHVGARLSDALNKREQIEISDVQWAPIDGSEGLEPDFGDRIFGRLQEPLERGVVRLGFFQGLPPGVN